MSFDSAYETIRLRIAGMNRQELIDHLLHFDGHLKLDFTEPFLKTLEDDRLRHILIAAYLTDSSKQPA